MIRFTPPKLTALAEVISYLHRFIPELGREIKRIENKIPAAAPGIQEVTDKLLDDPDFKDAIYRYIKDREARE